MMTVIAIGIVGFYPYPIGASANTDAVLPAAVSAASVAAVRMCPSWRVADAPVALPLPPSFVTDPTTGRLRIAKVPRQRWRQQPRRQRRRRSTTDVTVPTPHASSAWQMGSSSARSFGGGEYGNRNNVDARDQCCRVSLGGRIGRATMATASRRKTTTMLTRKRESLLAISWRSRYADFERGGDKKGRRAQQRRHGAVDVWDALPAGRRGSPVGSSLLSSSDGLPEAPIVSNNRGKGRWGGSILDETTMDRARTTATTEQGIHR